MASRRRKTTKRAKQQATDEIADPWQRMARALQAYKTLYDDTRVPPRWKINPDLARWVQEQLARKRRMPAEQARQLEKLGFWADHDAPRRQRAPRAAPKAPKRAKASKPAAKKRSPPRPKPSTDEEPKEERASPAIESAEPVEAARPAPEPMASPLIEEPTPPPPAPPGASDEPEDTSDSEQT